MPNKTRGHFPHPVATAKHSMPWCHSHSGVYWEAAVAPNLARNEGFGAAEERIALALSLEIGKWTTTWQPAGMHKGKPMAS